MIFFRNRIKRDQHSSIDQKPPGLAFRSRNNGYTNASNTISKHETELPCTSNHFLKIVILLHLVHVSSLISSMYANEITNLFWFFYITSLICALISIVLFDILFNQIWIPNIHNVITNRVIARYKCLQSQNTYKEKLNTEKNNNLSVTVFKVIWYLWYLIYQSLKNIFCVMLYLFIMYFLFMIIKWLQITQTRIILIEIEYFFCVHSFIVILHVLFYKCVSISIRCFLKKIHYKLCGDCNQSLKCILFVSFAIYMIFIIFLISLINGESRNIKHILDQSDGSNSGSNGHFIITCKFIENRIDENSAWLPVVSSTMWKMFNILSGVNTNNYCGMVNGNNINSDSSLFTSQIVYSIDDDDDDSTITTKQQLKLVVNCPKNHLHIQFCDSYIDSTIIKPIDINPRWKYVDISNIDDIIDANCEIVTVKCCDQINSHLIPQLQSKQAKITDKVKHLNYPHHHSDDEDNNNSNQEKLSMITRMRNNLQKPSVLIIFLDGLSNIKFNYKLHRLEKIFENMVNHNLTKHMYFQFHNYYNGKKSNINPIDTLLYGNNSNKNKNNYSLIDFFEEKDYFTTFISDSCRDQLKSPDFQLRDLGCSNSNYNVNEQQSFMLSSSCMNQMLGFCHLLDYSILQSKLIHFMNRYKYRKMVIKAKKNHVNVNDKNNNKKNNQRLLLQNDSATHIHTGGILYRNVPMFDIIDSNIATKVASDRMELELIENELIQFFQKYILLQQNVKSNFNDDHNENKEKLVHFNTNKKTRKMDKMLFQDTILMLLSQSGSRFGFNKHTKFGQIEANHAMLKMFIPKKYFKLYPKWIKNLKENEYKFVTIDDLRKTILFLTTIGSNNENVNHQMIMDRLSISSGSLDLLNDKVPSNRTCSQVEI